MIKKLILFFVVFMFTLFAKPTVSTLTQEEISWLKEHPVLVAQNESDYIPINFNKNGIIQGYSIDYMNLLAKKLGIEVKYVTDHSWDDYLNMAKEKKIDIVLNVVQTKQREEYLNFTESYLKSYPFIYSNKNKPITSVTELKNKTLAIPKGYYFEGLFKQNYPLVKLLSVKDNLEALKAVSTGKADATVGMSSTFEHLISEHFITNVAISGEAKVNDISNFFEKIGIRKDWKILQEILNKAINEVKYEEELYLKEKWKLIVKEFEQKSLKTFTKEQLSWIENKKVLKVYNEKDWAPYNYNENGEPKGYSIDYIKKVADELGLEVEFISGISWSEALEKLKSNELDLILNIAKNEKRENELLFTNNSYLKISNGFVLRKEAELIDDFEDLNGKKLAIVKDYYVDDYLKDTYPNIDVVTLDDSTEVVRAVSDGFADVGHGTLGSLQYVMLENYITNLKYVKENDSANSLYIAANKENKELIELLNKIESTLSTSDLKDIKKKWFITNEHKKPSFELTKEERLWLSENDIVLGVDNDYAPMNFLDEKKELNGLTIDFIKALETQIGKKIEFYSNSWPDVLNKAMNHEISGVVNINDSESRKEKLIFTKPYITIAMGIITKNDYAKSNKLEDFKNKILVVKRKTVEVEYLSKKYPSIKLMIVNDYKDALSLIKENKADGIFAPLPVIIHNIKQYLFTDLKVNLVHFNDAIGHQKIGIRSTNPILVSILNKGIAQIDTQKRDEIVDKWLKVEYEESESYTFLWNYLAGLILLILLLAIFIFVLKSKINKEVEKRLKIQKQNDEYDSILNGSSTILVLHSGSEMTKVNKAFLNFFDSYSNLEDFKRDYGCMFNLFKDYKNKSYISSANTNANTWVEELYDKNQRNLKVILSKDGHDEHFLIHISIVKLHEQSFYLIELINITLEILQSKEIENKNRIITEQSKMVALGEMIGNIAHQWRQPLTIISSISSSYKLKEDMNIQIDKKEFVHDMDKITETSKYLSQTIDDFRNFIKGDKFKDEFNVSSTINKALNIVGTAMANHFINIQTKMKGNLKIESYENELIQCLSNILNNAKDALKDISEDNRVVRVFLEEFEEGVVITIHDNAGGIPEEILEKVFEPYFTTKHESQGTGLGLYMCYKIINESLNGNIKIENEEIVVNNEVFVGAKIIIQLPKKLTKK